MLVAMWRRSSFPLPPTDRRTDGWTDGRIDRKFVRLKFMFGRICFWPSYFLVRIFSPMFFVGRNIFPADFFSAENIIDRNMFRWGKNWPKFVPAKIFGGAKRNCFAEGAQWGGQGWGASPLQNCFTWFPPVLIKSTASDPDNVDVQLQIQF